MIVVGRPVFAGVYRPCLWFWIFDRNVPYNIREIITLLVLLELVYAFLGAYDWQDQLLLARGGDDGDLFIQISVCFSPSHYCGHSLIQRIVSWLSEQFGKGTGR